MRPSVTAPALLFALLGLVACKQREAESTEDRAGEAGVAGAKQPAGSGREHGAGAALEPSSGTSSGEGGERGGSREAAQGAAGEPRAGLASPLPGADRLGPVYFTIDGERLARLDEVGVTVLLDEPRRRLRELLVGPDGAVYLLDARSLRKVLDETLVEVERFSFDDVAPVDALALGSDGAMWVSNARGVAGRVDGEWKFHSREQLGVDFSAELAIDGEGTVWLSSAKQLLRHPKGGGWIPVDLGPLVGAPLLLELESSASGSVLATDGKQLIRLHATGLERIPLERRPAARAELIGYTAGFDLAPDGVAALASGRCDLIRVDPRAPAPWTLAGSRYGCATVEALAIDGRHRIWVASREGLSVIEPDGSIVEYPAGSFPALAGRVGQVLALGRGPHRLPPVSAPLRATITGRILVEDEPLAGAAIEMCPTIGLYGRGSPCSAAKVRFAGVTDENGGFRFEDAPIGNYSFAVEADGKWRWSTPPSFAARLRAGEVHDLGVLALPRL